MGDDDLKAWWWWNTGMWGASMGSNPRSLFSGSMCRPFADTENLDSSYLWDLKASQVASSLEFKSFLQYVECVLQKTNGFWFATSHPPVICLTLCLHLFHLCRIKDYVYQTLVPWESTSPVPNTAVKKLKRVSYIIPSFAVRASSNTKCDSHFGGGANSFLLVSQMGQNAWAALSDWPRSYYQNAFWEIFGFCFATSHSLDPRLTSLPGLGRCPVRQQNHQRDLPQPQPDWWRGS